MAQPADSFARDSRANVQKSTVVLSHTVSMAFLEMQGQNARKFQVPQLAMRNVLLHEAHESSANYELELLSRVHVHRIFIEPGTENQLPVALGIKIAAFPGTQYTASGEAWNYVLPAGFKAQSPEVVFESDGDESLMATWERDFARWNASNLETLLVVSMPDSDIVLLHLEHPVTKYLDKKAEDAGTVQPYMQNSSTPNWRQIALALFQQSCQWIRQNILSKSSKTYDLSTLLVAYDRVDGKKFNKLSPEVFHDMHATGLEEPTKLNEMKTAYANYVMQRPCTVTLKLGFEYRLASAPQAHAHAGMPPGAQMPAGMPVPGA